MDHRLPGIVVTGASGFVGRHFLAAAADKYRLFCLARRSQQEAGIPATPNLRWSQVDIGRRESLDPVLRGIQAHGGADFVLHLAGYYDFAMREHPEYHNTNVLGTQNLLQIAKELRIKRFIFASSLAACNFPAPGHSITEDASAEADFPYARSKRQGEDLVREFTEYFATAIVRMAVVFSDWCEYPPLYVFLETWLSRGWRSRILAGRGMSAVTYVHIQDLIKLVFRIIERSDSLPTAAVYNASTNQSASHRDLFLAATRFYYGKDIKPVCLPRPLAWLGVNLRYRLGDLLGRPPFEAPWMVRYIDKELNVDARRTQTELDWHPASRLGIHRRLLVMIENLKTHRDAWVQRNEAALRKVGQRPNLIIAEALENMGEQIVSEVRAQILARENAERFGGYRDMDEEVLSWLLRLILQALVTSVRIRDRRLVRQYAQIIAVRRRDEGFQIAQVQEVLAAIGRAVLAALRGRPELADFSQQIHDNVSLCFQLAADGVEDAFDAESSQQPEFLERLQDLELPVTAKGLELMVARLQDLS